MSSKQKVLVNIRNWLSDAFSALQKAEVPSPVLDAELILSNVLQCDRTQLHAYPEKNLKSKDLIEVNMLLARRQKREPLVYIFGKKEFYGRDFKVTPDVLIPRPETEEIIELLKQYPSKNRLLDVGTGSGAIGITAKLEFPELSVTLSDISPVALTVARTNAKKLGAKPLRFIQSNLLEHWLSHTRPKLFDIIVANLPYVDETWERSPETAHEPSLALFADDRGLQLIKKCVGQAQKLLITGGVLLLEADMRQHAEIIRFAKEYGFQDELVSGLIVGLKKI